MCLNIEVITLGEIHPDVAISYGNIGEVWKNRGEYHEALKFYNQCLEIQTNHFGRDHHDVATTKNKIEELLSLIGNKDIVL